MNALPIPKELLDVSIGAFVVLLVLLIIREIVKLVERVKDRKSGSNGNQSKIPCAQSPVIQGIASNQNMYIDTTKRLEVVLHSLSENSVKQTFVLEALQKTLDNSLTLQTQQSRMLDRMCIKLDVEEKL